LRCPTVFGLKAMSQQLGWIVNPRNNAISMLRIHMLCEMDNVMNPSAFPAHNKLTDGKTASVSSYCRAPDWLQGFWLSVSRYHPHPAAETWGESLDAALSSAARKAPAVPDFPYREFGR